MAIPTGVISWISSLVFTWMAAKTGKRCLSAIVATLVPFSGTIILYCLPRSNVGGSLAGLYILFCYWGPYIVVQTIMVSVNDFMYRWMLCLRYANMISGNSTQTLLDIPRRQPYTAFLTSDTVLVSRIMLLETLAISLPKRYYVHSQVTLSVLKPSRLIKLLNTLAVLQRCCHATLSPCY